MPWRGGIERAPFGCLSKDRSRAGVKKQEKNKIYPPPRVRPSWKRKKRSVRFAEAFEVAFGDLDGRVAEELGNPVDVPVLSVFGQGVKVPEVVGAVGGLYFARLVEARDGARDAFFQGVGENTREGPPEGEAGIFDRFQGRRGKRP